jgi:hypothetical protein
METSRWRVEFEGCLSERDALCLGHAGIEYLFCPDVGCGRHAVIVECHSAASAVAAVREVLGADAVTSVICNAHDP